MRTVSSPEGASNISAFTMYSEMLLKDADLLVLPAMVFPMALARSVMEANLRWGFFLRHFLIILWSLRGMFLFNLRGGIGLSFSILADTDIVSSSSNGFTPVNISYKAMPKENMSDWTSRFWPSICSGDIYAGVPKNVPGWVRV